MGTFGKLFINAWGDWRLLKEASDNSIARLKDQQQIITGQTITKSVSSVQRRTGFIKQVKPLSLPEFHLAAVVEYW